MKRQLFGRAFFLLVVLAVLFFLGYVFYLQWAFWWFDMVLHFLGGAVVAMGGVATWLYLFPETNSDITKIILTALFWVIFIGILWELYEVHFGITFLSDGIVYVRDTASDLIMDICGGIFGVLYTLRLSSKKTLQIL